MAPALATSARCYAVKPAAPGKTIRLKCLIEFPIKNASTAAKKKKLGKLGPIMEKKVIPVETDANKLVNYVCGSNYLKTGEDVKVSSRSLSVDRC